MRGRLAHGARIANSGSCCCRGCGPRSAHAPRDRSRPPKHDEALADPDTLDHRAARQSLDAIGRRYLVAYASPSLTGLTAVVRSGQAVAVLTRPAVTADLRILSDESGLPPLPNVGIGVTIGARRPSALVNAFARHVRERLPEI